MGRKKAFCESSFGSFVWNKTKKASKLMVFFYFMGVYPQIIIKRCVYKILTARDMWQDWKLWQFFTIRLRHKAKRNECKESHIKIVQIKIKKSWQHLQTVYISFVYSVLSWKINSVVRDVTFSCVNFDGEAANWWYLGGIYGYGQRFN